MKKIALFVFIIVFTITCILVLFSNKSYTMNRKLRYAAEKTDYIYLADITPFEWDKAYIIEDSYVGGESLDKIVNTKCNLQRLNTDWKKRIVFVKNDQFAFDYVYNTTRIMFLDLGKSVDKANCKFKLTQNENGLIILKLAE